jgi:hypothetical protein
MPEQRSPNVLSLGDTVALSLWGWPEEHAYPFEVEIVGFEGDRVKVRSLDISDDALVDNEWIVPYGYLRRTMP